MPPIAIGSSPYCNKSPAPPLFWALAVGLLMPPPLLNFSRLRRRRPHPCSLHTRPLHGPAHLPLPFPSVNVPSFSAGPFNTPPIFSGNLYNFPGPIGTFRSSSAVSSTPYNFPNGPAPTAPGVPAPPSLCAHFTHGTVRSPGLFW
jgi:hypothetical protein